MVEDKNVNEEYAAMRSAMSNRQLKWISAYNKNPELASIVLDIFDMSDDEIRFAIQMLSGMRDGLYFYKDSLKRKSSSGKKKQNVIAAMV